MYIKPGLSGPGFQTNIMSPIPVIKEDQRVVFAHKDFLFEIENLPFEDAATIKGYLSAWLKTFIEKVIEENKRYPSRVLWHTRGRSLFRKEQGLFTYGDYIKLRYKSR